MYWILTLQLLFRVTKVSKVTTNNKGEVSFFVWYYAFCLIALVGRTYMDQN